MISDETETFTLTECCGSGKPDYIVAVINVLMMAIALVAVCCTLWRIFAIYRPGPAKTSVLGLDEGSATYTESCDRSIPWRTLFLYVLTSVVTFKLGVLAFETFWYLMGLLPDWLSRIINGN